MRQRLFEVRASCGGGGLHITARYYASCEYEAVMRLRDNFALSDNAEINVWEICS